jgi:hypothetical protein
MAGGSGAHVTKRLAPDASATSYWLVPSSSSDSRRAVVLAVDDAGVLIFCRQFSLDEVKGNLRWQVDITPGPTDCG